MSAINLAATITICEDTNGTFDLRDILASVKYNTDGKLSISSFGVFMPGTTIPVSGNTTLFGLVDADTIYVRPGAYQANYNGNFGTFEFVLDQGTSGSTPISLTLNVIVTPVNDAPTAANKTFDLGNGAPVVLAQGDFGFVDAVEHDAFMSVIITSLPTSGKLMLNGVAVTVNAEISAADIAAGKLSFEPSQTTSGDFNVGFKVRDAGGLVGCDAADTSATPNYLTFKVPQAHLGDFVWEDSNGNGVQDSGEAGIANVVVELKDADGHVVTTTTDANGKYHFDVNAGTYTVTVQTPAGYAVAPQDQGGDDATDSDIGANGSSGAIVLTPGQTNNTVDAGLYRPATLGDTVWIDTNRNGVQDGAEAGVAGVKVILLDANGNATGATVTTDENGHYQFSGLKPGSYSVQFDKATLPSHYSFTDQGQGGDATKDSDANVTTGKTAQVTLASGDNYQHLDAGIVVDQATVGDRVWEDSNGNGVQDSGEQGIDGVTVNLKDANGNIVNTVSTHDGGKYSFTVDPGTYTVSVAKPAGFVFTGAGKGGNGAADSDVNASGDAVFTLTAGQNNPDIDAGVYRPASLSQVVWFDADRDGRLDDGESFAAGVKVILLDANGNPIPGAVATTDANGHYQFTDLAPGSYSVQFDKSSLPVGYDFTSAASGGPGSGGSDADTGTGKTTQVTLASGDDMTLRAGLVIQQATLGDRVWEDKNGNGIQDAGEAGIVGVKVDLKDEAGNVVKTTTTGADGKYSFTVDPGKYSISVTAPSGMTATGSHTGADAVDSDIDANGQSGLVTLTAGQTNNNVDAGFYKGATLGDRVWLDSNRNGVQDSGETGVAGVKVILLDAAGNPTGATATTDNSGVYSFTNLKPGTYSVQFDKTTLPANHAFTTADQGNDAADSDANVGTGKTAQVTLASGDVNNTLDAGIVSTKAKLGDFVWEDSNGNGVQDAGEAGICNVTVQLKDSTGKVVQTTTTDADGKYSFTADAGNYTVSVTAPKDYVFTGKDVGDDAKDSDFSSTGQSNAITLKAGDDINTIDAGLYKTASIGDKVWLDSNKDGIQNNGEGGLCGVKVTLLDANGKKVGNSVTTDANGNYLFTGLKPGTYSVQFDKDSLPEGMSFTAAGKGSSDSTDSDVNANGLSHSVTLTSGQVDKTVDAGVLAAATIGDRVWLDKNGNGVQDSGESGKSGVTVQLRDTSGTVIKTTTTDSDGNYKFSVEAGTYSVDVKAPTGFQFTTQNAGNNNATDSNADSSGKLGSVTVSAGQNVTNMDAGLVQPKSEIGDKVWCDTNGDGIQNNGESGVKGVKVTLLNEKGVAIATATTDANGLYAFKDLDAGKYSVKFSAVDGYAFTKQNVGSNDGIDSDVDANGLGAQFTLAAGVVDKTHDAGIVKTGSIGNRVWEDSNANGIQDSGEKGVDGVTVKLYDASTGALKGTTVTKDGGTYLFDDLAAGNYKVEVTNSTGWFFTKSGAGTDATDSDITSISGSTGKTGSISLAAGQDITTEDAGIYRKASIGDKVWRDANHNGVQDKGEEGIGGITVSLYDAATKTKLATTKTAADGTYKFDGLTPDDYYLQFDKTNVKVTFASDKGTYNMSDWKWGVKNTGSNDAIDSDVAGDGKALTNVTKTDTITLSSGENDMSWDAAITPIAIDLNGDGIHTIARKDMTGTFDLLGTGKAIQSGWLSGSDGFLAIDSNGNGQIDDISELFGGSSKGSGFAKLGSYDSNGDGVVNASDALFSSLMIWQDANSNGKTDAGELISLEKAGVVSLTVAHTELPFLDANNNLHLERSSVTLSNGKVADMTDVYFNVDAADAAAAGITSNLAQLIGQTPAEYA